MPNSRKAETNPPTSNIPQEDISSQGPTPLFPGCQKKQSGHVTLFSHWSRNFQHQASLIITLYFVHYKWQLWSIWCLLTLFFPSQQEHFALTAAGFWGAATGPCALEGLSGDVFSSPLPKAGPASQGCVGTYPAKFEPLQRQRFYNQFRSLSIFVSIVLPFPYKTPREN